MPVPEAVIQEGEELLRASYGAHYRRLLPALLDVLEFRSNNAAHRPVIRALDLLKAVLGEFEYRNLDEFEEFRGRNTTTEFLAGEIHRRLARQIKEGVLGSEHIASLKVVLRENPVAWASYDAALE